MSAEVMLGVHFCFKISDNKSRPSETEGKEITLSNNSFGA